ncbi:MAG: hypothetical protein ACYC1M_08265 [Armatimonadota bacterium]
MNSRKKTFHKCDVITAIIVAVIVLWFAAWSFIGWQNSHYYVKLPGGYECYYTSVFSSVIIHNTKGSLYLQEKQAIGPAVGRYHAFNNVIVGQITPLRFKPPEGIDYGLYEMRPGYFIIDVRTKKVYGGLNMHDWMQKLKAYGITETPKLHKPSWLDMYFGQNKPDER